MRLVITGTPGTGKTSIARELSKKTGVFLVELNKIARPYDKEGDVNLKKLREKTLREIKGKNDFIIEGHLACEFSIPKAIAVVLRCKPEVLEKRLGKRKYPEKKINENVLAEALDYCLIKSGGNYKRIIQINTTKKISTNRVVDYIKSFKTDEVNWFESLRKIALKTY
jgi:adenylate kinase